MNSIKNVSAESPGTSSAGSQGMCASCYIAETVMRSDLPANTPPPVAGGLLV